jgi:hypothetical protein
MMRKNTHLDATDMFRGKKVAGNNTVINECFNHQEPKFVSQDRSWSWEDDTDISKESRGVEKHPSSDVKGRPGHGKMRAVQMVVATTDGVQATRGLVRGHHR